MELLNNVLQKENISTRSNEKEQRINTILSVDSATMSASTNNAPDMASLSDGELAQMMKPLTMDYEDRVNDTALLPPPTNAVPIAHTSHILPPLVHESEHPFEGLMTPPPIVPPNLPIATAKDQLLPSSHRTSSNELLNATNNFLLQSNEPLQAENEALRAKLVAGKQLAVEAVQRVQLKAYIAETARDAAEERTRWLESVSEDVVAEMARKDVLPVAYHLQRSPHPVSSPGAALPLSNRMAPLPPSGSMHNDVLGRSPDPSLQSTFYNHHQGNNQGNGSRPSAFPSAPRGSVEVSTDFWEPPWVRNESPSLGVNWESVRLRLRRGD